MPLVEATFGCSKLLVESYNLFTSAYLSSLQEMQLSQTHHLDSVQMPHAIFGPQYKTDFNKLKWVQKASQKGWKLEHFPCKKWLLQPGEEASLGENNSSLPVSTMRLWKRWSQALHGRRMGNNRHNKKQESFRPEIGSNSFREQSSSGAACPEKLCSLN